MSTEENKKLSTRIFEELFNQGKANVADEVIDPSYVEHAELPPGFVPDKGPALYKQYISLVRTAFPDFRYTIEDQIADGDRVAARATARGIHQGDFFGIPATGKQIVWTEIHFGRFSNGKLVEHWAIQDMLSIMQQMGVIPMPARPQQQRRAA